eukprot:CAMPEP_0178944874 /NCGR_PEP_ID=MMETSP0789-20121207/3405_1 /TAXON_ID=3005 /ORGANISM="Rhizosolenia setigera, Strain CCMP 1694" /LENGTH=546 /DNA_ID=CAMNT_0020624669 /DNA_START=55 /DNA_END=1695 /DNA_ORIENTATION=+
MSNEMDYLDDVINVSETPTNPPTIVDKIEKEHEFDAEAALILNAILIGCVLLSYYIKVNRIYYLPESAAAMMVGVVIGGLARLFVDDDGLQLFSFSPEIFFFVLLPPIIFEAGYSLEKKHFFDNLGAITLYAVFGTMISTFTVGYLCILGAKKGFITSIDADNPMEPLLFGALISAVDPVATLSIMGSPELQCDRLLYSLVFGESVLNDAVAIVLFKTFRKYYSPDMPDMTESDIPRALLSFLSVSIFSIVVGVGLGLISSFIYKHSNISQFPKFETALLFLFCYLCYATAEAIELSGIMALFFNGVVLSHYNSYNLSKTAHVTSDHIFATLAVVMETIVFLYMGMGVFTGKFNNWDLRFTICAFIFCLIGRFANIFPLSWFANLCRKRNIITKEMQFVLWFVGLRGAIAFALSENMPGPNKDIYATATLSICMFTTIFCGGFTERILSTFNMKQPDQPSGPSSFGGDEFGENYLYDNLVMASPIVENVTKTVYKGTKGMWTKMDDKYLKPLFGGADESTSINDDDEDDGNDSIGGYELSDVENRN